MEKCMLRNAQLLFSFYFAKQKRKTKMCKKFCDFYEVLLTLSFSRLHTVAWHMPISR